MAPTRELVAQIEENVRAYGRHLPLRAATVYGGVSERPQLEALRSGVDLVVATPGRLIDLMSRRLCDFTKLQLLVLDEADSMLDMGFLPDIRRIVKGLPPHRQTLLFSATLSREIEAIMHEFLRAPKTIQIGRRANPAETVAQLVYEVPKHFKPALLVHLLRQPRLNMVLVFSRMKHGADRLARSLEAHGIRTATLHSNRSQNQRLRALKDFKSGAVRVLVATDIAARGIDVDASRTSSIMTSRCTPRTTSTALGARAAPRRWAMPSALWHRKIRARCARSNASSAGGSCGNVPRDSTTRRRRPPK